MTELIKIIEKYAPEHIKINPNDRLKEDIGLCSLDFLTIILDVEANLDKKVDMSKLIHAITVEDFWNCLEIRK